jgi:uncharacterized cofD-like protein
VNSPKIVALGGGHGLHASLSALRRLTADLTAVVTVADDGGSSGRIRRELPVLPPGDLRMALAALASADPAHQKWVDLLQHRIGGTGGLAGHPVGNLLLTGLLEREEDAVAALAQAAELVGAVGHVLPMSPVPLALIADVDRFDPDDPARTREIRGQVSIATTPGRIRAVRLLPNAAPACATAVDAIHDADAVVLGPGSWFTSVLPHLLLRELGKALATTRARVIVTLNLVPQAGETDEYSPADLLRVLLEHAEPWGGLRVHTVIADRLAVPDLKQLQGFLHVIDARLVLSDLTADDSAERHDPQRLSDAYRQALADIGSGEGARAWQ